MPSSDSCYSFHCTCSALHITTVIKHEVRIKIKSNKKKKKTQEHINLFIKHYTKVVKVVGSQHSCASTTDNAHSEVKQLKNTVKI